MAAEKTLFLIAVEKTLLPMAENPGGGGGRGGGMASYLWLWSSTRLTRPEKPSVVDKL